MQKATELLLEHLSTFQIERQSSTEVTFSISQDDRDKFPKLLTNLTAMAAELGMKNYQPT